MLRHLRIIPLAVVAAGALMVLGGAGTASATVFCSTTTTPCGSVWPANTVLKFALKTNVPFKFVEPGGGVFDECPESSLKAKIVKPK